MGLIKLGLVAAAPATPGVGDACLFVLESDKHLYLLDSDGTSTDLTGVGGLGTAAVEDVGTGPGNVVQLDEEGKLPAVDGSALTGLPELPTLGTAAVEDVGTAEGNIPVLGSGGRLARATTPAKTTAVLTDAATITPDLTAADTFTLTITEARNLGDATLPGIGAWPITVTGDFALSTHVNWPLDPNGLAADPATGTRVFWMYSLDGASKNILIVAV